MLLKRQLITSRVLNFTWSKLLKWNCSQISPIRTPIHIFNCSKRILLWYLVQPHCLTSLVIILINLMHCPQTFVQSDLHPSTRVVKLVTQLINILLLEVLGLKMHMRFFVLSLYLFYLVILNKLYHLLVVGLVDFNSFQSLGLGSYRVVLNLFFSYSLKLYWGWAAAINLQKSW